MVYRNNAGRLGAGSISVCLETRWLGQNRGFYEPEPYCISVYLKQVHMYINASRQDGILFQLLFFF